MSRNPTPCTPFPFSLPDGMAAEVAKNMLMEMMVFEGLQGHHSNDPVFFGIVESLASNLLSCSNGLDFLLNTAAPAPGSPAELNHEQAVDAHLIALKSEVSKLWGVVVWARQTWQHDPAVRALVELDKTIETLSTEGDES